YLRMNDSRIIYELTETQYKTLMGVKDEYKDKTFSILVVGEVSGTYQSDDFTTSAGSGGIDYGDTFYTEVKARNDKVESDYGLTLDVQKLDSPRSAAENDALSGTYLYDAMILNVNDMVILAQGGYLADLNKLENFDNAAPWWDQSASKAYSISNHLYFTTGDITIMNKANTWSILFNKDMVKQNGLESPYDLVDSGDWTFDKMCELAKAVNTAEKPQDCEDATKVFGMVSAYGDIQEFWGGCHHTITDKNAADEPELVFGKDEASINDLQHILEVMKDAYWNFYAQRVNFTKQFETFYTGRALFRPSGFTATTKCRFLAEMEFGIVPLPKRNKEQDGYTTVTTGTFVAGILKNCEDPEFSAYCLDAFAAEAKNFVTPAYIDSNLKWKSLRDNESERMLDYIFSHITYDVGRIYNFGEINQMFSNLASSDSTDVVSSFDGIRTNVELAIENIIADYRANEG
ncbi:MAG: extracellular solute-binding protein, partial [Clostridia bacterium]|nr:extracellular solute-binding protein [Clostridia bacterium]